MKSAPNLDFAQAGMAAVLPGLQYALDYLQSQVDHLRIQLAAAQGAAVPGEAPPKKRGRPPKQTPVPVQQLSTQAAYWAAMTPEERKAEMKRRMKLGALRKSAKTKLEESAASNLSLRGKPRKMHPRDPRSPDHKTWVKRLAKARSAAMAARANTSSVPMVNGTAVV